MSVPLDDVAGLVACLARQEREIEQLQERCIVLEVERKQLKEMIPLKLPISKDIFGYLKSSELDSARRTGGSINLWLKKYDCDLTIYGSTTEPNIDMFVEALAKMTYNQWKGQPDFCEWQPGGNSDKQYEARSIVRKTLDMYHRKQL